MDRMFSGRLPSGVKLNSSPKNIHIAQVVAVGKLAKSSRSNNENINKNLARFNADEHAIRCVIVGSEFDGGGDYPDIYNLPNCFPLIPKHINIVPKVGEFVIIMLIGDDEKYNDRFYIGPIISSAVKLNEDTAITALSNFIDGTTETTPQITPNGVYENKQNVVIEGRDNTDIIQRPNEVLIRSGKFKLNSVGKPLDFNSRNPGYIQIKSDFNIRNERNDTTKQVSVTNIVSDRINLLSYDGTPDFSSDNGLTKVSKRGKDTQTGGGLNEGNVSAEYIDDKKLEEILKGAHPLPFGDILVEYLILMRKALLNHCHNIDKAIDDDSKGEKEVEIFEKAAKGLEEKMLSKNIRIN